MSKIALSPNISGTGTLTISAPNTNSDRAIALPDAAGTIALQGGAISGTTGTFTGLLDISAAGAGQIKFPATQNASANANTLDDYEEGSFAPTIRGTTTVGTASYSAQNGSYVKVGRLVHFQLFVDWGSGTGTGDLEVGGLPFNTTNDSTFPAVTIGYANAVALTANTTPVALLRNNGNAVYFYQIPSGGGSNIILPYDAGGSLIIAGTYKTGS